MQCSKASIFTSCTLDSHRYGRRFEPSSGQKLYEAVLSYFLENGRSTKTINLWFNFAVVSQSLQDMLVHTFYAPSFAGLRGDFYSFTYLVPLVVFCFFSFGGSVFSFCSPYNIWSLSFILDYITFIYCCMVQCWSELMFKHKISNFDWDNKQKLRFV